MKRSPIYRPFLFQLFAALTLLIGIATFSQAQDTPNTRIKNFGQMDARFFRGAQPKQNDYRDLAAIGIHTIIDLRQDPESYEKPSAEAVGIRYVNIPMSDKDYPRSEQITQFLKLVDDPATGKFFVHCAGGRHRTGVMGAVYRFTHDKWNYDQVYAEMKHYDFYTRFGHGAMKKYVEDYWQQMQASNTGVATGVAGTVKR